MQIGAELLCKSAKVRDKKSGLGSQPSGAGFRYSGSGTGSGPEFFPAPGPGPDHPCLKPEGRDLGPENASRTLQDFSRSQLPGFRSPFEFGFSLANWLTDTRTRRRRAPTTYFFAAFGLALARFSFRTEGRVARGLTGDLAR